MSNRLAIAAVTATLRSLLATGVGISEVTARPLDLARGNNANGGDQLNLFLYQALPDAAWRNRDMPRQTKPNETGLPPLPLTLYYLLTAYSGDDNDTSAHKLLGNAMGVLHDHPLLSAAEIKNATSAGSGLEDSDLHEQLERVRITLQPLTFEEISKLWTTFQTHYRTSAAYQVSLVLIESKRPSKTPLPVLKRGEDDRGVTSQPDMIPPFPVLTSLKLPPRRLSAQPGDTISVIGSRLAGGTVRLRSLRLASPPPSVTLGVIDAQLDVTLHNDLAPGFYTIAVELPSPHGTITSNELALAVAPVIDPPLPLTRPRELDGTAMIDLSCSVAVLAEQRVALLVGDFEVRREPPPVAPTKLFKFIIHELPDGDLPVPINVPLLARLRVDGVDSEILAPLQPGEPESTPPEFDASKRITIT